MQEKGYGSVELNQSFRSVDMKIVVIFLLLVQQNIAQKQPVGNAVNNNNIELRAAKFVDNAEEQLSEGFTKLKFASWNYQSNITDETQKVSQEVRHQLSFLFRKFGKEAQIFDLSKVRNKDVRRKLKGLKSRDVTALSDDKYKEFNKLKADMKKTYRTAQVPEWKSSQHQLSLGPVYKKMSNSRDEQELRYYWEQWRESSGKNIKDQYKTYVQIYNEAAKLNGFSDATLMQVDNYESDSFIEEMETTWQGLKPLYEQLHAYVRNKLYKFYGGEVVDNQGPIPAHLLGNIFAHSWTNIGDLLTPYPNKPSINVTSEMVKQGWTPTKMFQKADDFFQSMGMIPLPEKFWSGSILEKPEDGREINCHPSAWDFENAEDFRIKQCTRVTQQDFVTVNHEMGHVQYYLQYKNQSFLNRGGANPGFQEAVGDVLSLAVETATYFQRLGLLDNKVDVMDKETNINILFNMALERLAFLPFGYLVDKFRWDVFSGKTSVENMNCHWWKLRNRIQGLKPPSPRSKGHFDPGSKHHVAAGIGYVKYFTAYIYEFQFYRALCLASGKYEPGNPNKPLHQCNFYGSIEAGDKLKEMLKLGANKPWKEAMRTMTGQPNMSSMALREYFSPLELWLKQENEISGVQVGWGETNVDDLCEIEQSSTGQLPPVGLAEL